MLYKINFLVNGISHANLVEASNIELAKSFFIKEHLDGDATRLVEIKENNESYKPGQPCWKVPDDWKVKVLWFSRHEMILSILVYTFFTRMFDFMLPLVVKYSIVAA